MRMFATKTVGNLMERLSLPDDVPITHRLVTKAIANAQRQVESQNFERRKNVLKYDEVMNKQRQVIYETRRQVLEGGEELRDQTLGFLGDVVSGLVAEYCPQGVYPEEWDLDGLFKSIAQLYPTQLDPDTSTWTASTTTSSRTCSWTTPNGPTRSARPSSGPTCCTRSSAEFLTVLDRHWREHLYEMDYLEGIGLRAIGQRDPWSSTSARASTCSWPCRTPSSARPWPTSSTPPSRSSTRTSNAARPPACHQPSSPPPPPKPSRRPPPPPSPSAPPARRSAATNPAPAAQARSTSSATAPRLAPEPTGGVLTTTRRRPSFI